MAGEWIRESLPHSLSPGEAVVPRHVELDGSRMALNRNILLPPFCCHSFPRSQSEVVREVAGLVAD